MGPDSFIFSPSMATKESKNQSGLTVSEKKKIAGYLENPVSSGLWSAHASWIFDSGLSIDVANELANEIGTKEHLSLRSGKRERKIRIDDQWVATVKRLISSQITFNFKVFSYLHQAEKSPINEDGEGIDAEYTQVILDIIDVENIKSKYSEALHFFAQEIWFPGFSPRCRLDSPFQTKHGAILIKERTASGRLVALSWDPSPLKATLEFLKLIGKVQEPRIMPIYSPEEEVFAPYFSLLELAYDMAVPQPHLQPFVQKAIANFKDENFTDCVSAIGLASEDVLTQIYETLYREQLTKGLTLGQLADEISTKAAARFKKKEDVQPDLGVLFPEIKAAIEGPDLTTAEVAALLRKMLVLVIDGQRYTHGKIEKVGRVERRYSIFPEFVTHSLTELIRFRNAASHKSRIPIGPVECRRAAHAFVVLISWWLRERDSIDWAMSPDEILKHCLDRSSRVIP